MGMRELGNFSEGALAAAKIGSALEGKRKMPGFLRGKRGVPAKDAGKPTATKERVGTSILLERDIMERRYEEAEIFQRGRMVFFGCAWGQWARS
jgi:hypothetical protein